MSTASGLTFTPVPLRPDVWKAEVTGFTYSIFKSRSGYVVHCGSPGNGRSGDTPMESSPRGLHPSFEAAVAACEQHYRKMMQ